VQTIITWPEYQLRTIWWNLKVTNASVTLATCNTESRLVRCKQLLRKFPEHSISFIWYTDEKVFTVTPPINTQNDRLYVSATTMKRDVDAECLLRTRQTFSRSVMVSVAVSKLGCSDMFWSQGQRCILPRCPLKEANVASHPAYVRGLHLPAGQCTCTPCTGNHRAATTWNPRLHWTGSLASELIRPRSSQLQDLEADTRTRLPDSDTGHRWPEAAPYLCLGWAEAVSLIKPLNSGGQGCEPAFVQRGSTSNSC